MEDALDAIERKLQRVGRDLGTHRFEALADRRGADVDRYRGVAVERQTRRFARARSAAFQITTDGQPVITPIDQATAQPGFLVPADLRETAIQRHAVVAAVRFRGETVARAYGISCSAMRLRRRKSTRSTPSSDAAMSRSRSRKKSASKRPGPR